MRRPIQRVGKGERGNEIVEFALIASFFAPMLLVYIFLIDRFDSVSHVEFRLTLPSTSADLQVVSGRGTTWRDNDAVADRDEYLRDRHDRELRVPAPSLRR